MKYSKVNPNNYDFLWKFGVSYHFCSVWVESGYKDGDFILYNFASTNTTFISKKQKQELVKKALQAYGKDFSNFKSGILSKLLIYSREIKRIKNVEAKKLSNKELKKEYLAATNLGRQMWADYFIMEYHSTDAAAQARPKDKTIRRNLEEVGHLKFKVRNLLNHTIYPPTIFDKFLQEIARRIKLKYSPEFYSYKELVKALEGKKIGPPDRRGHVIRGQFNSWQDIVGNEAKALYTKLVGTTNKNEVRGTTGNPGFYQGIVKIIHFDSQTDLSKEISVMKKGQVLISGTTGPEMILACKKAGAIVTEEGGIISHAVIISRELGIPSVIGTRTATTVFKDGDLVEVDATNGIVRKIK